MASLQSIEQECFARSIRIMAASFVCLPCVSPLKKFSFKGQVPHPRQMGITDACIKALGASSSPWCSPTSQTSDIELITFWANPITAGEMQTCTAPASAWLREIHFVVVVCPMLNYSCGGTGLQL